MNLILLYGLCVCVRYTEEEVEMLKRQHHEHGSLWQKIGQSMDRSGQSLNDKFKKLKTTASTST